MRIKVPLFVTDLYIFYIYKYKYKFCILYFLKYKVSDKKKPGTFIDYVIS